MLLILNSIDTQQAEADKSLKQLRLSVYKARMSQKSWKKEKAKVRYEDFRSYQEVRSMIPDSFVHITIV